MLEVCYLSRDILKWEGNITGASIEDSDKVKRAYDIFYHSESLVNSNTNKFHLSDSLLNLKRALNHRLKLIEELYNFKSIPFKNKPNGYIELLESYGLTRPYVLKKLIEIRNNIEHYDECPPNIERCRELLDITWYFLKSTDRLVSYIHQDMELQPNPIDELPDKHSCSIDINFTNTNFKIIGWFPISYINKKKSENRIKINCEKIHNGLYWKSKDSKYHKNKTENDIWLTGELELNPEDKHELYKKSFISF